MTIRTIAGIGLLVGTAPLQAQRSGHDGNLEFPPQATLERMCNQSFEIVAAKGAGAGVMGARRWHLRFDDGKELDVKWKEAPDGGEGWNNSPRLEVAAYVVQQLFLDPDDQVVPPVCGLCIPFRVYRAASDDPSANLPDATCVFGASSAWLSNVKQPDEAFQPKRFASDPTYAYHFAHLNLFTYLISQHDGRGSNFLRSTVPSNPQLFMVDNGISFNEWIYNWFAWHLNSLRVGRLERRSVARLRQLSQQDLDRLGVMEQFQRDRGGVYRRVESGPNLDPHQGTRLVGDVLQYGLTEDEIADLSARIRKVLERVDAGELTLFDGAASTER